MTHTPVGRLFDGPDDAKCGVDPHARRSDARAFANAMVKSTPNTRSGMAADFGGAPGLNARNQIAFQGTTHPDPNLPDDSGLAGIFTGGDPVADRIIAVGDALDGSTVSGLDPLCFASSLNNAGQIAFLVFLADGRTGVYRADPVRGDRP